MRKVGQATRTSPAYGGSVKPETRTFYEAAVMRAVERVGASLDEALDLDALAREAALSALHFQRVFCGVVGETPLELHRRLRRVRGAYRSEGAESGSAVHFGLQFDTCDEARELDLGQLERSSRMVRTMFA
jgi:AraC-like DNA-binding protein